MAWNGKGTAGTDYWKEAPLTKSLRAGEELVFVCLYVKEKGWIKKNNDFKITLI